MIKNITIIIFFNVLIFLVYSNFQNKISINENLGYDGVYYYNMSEQFQDGETLKTNAPFVYRIATPYLASLFSNIKQSYFYINIIASIVSSILIYLIFIKYFEIKVSLILAIFSQLHWISGIRYVLFDPIGVDNLALCFLYLGILVLISEKNYNQKLILICLITFFGIFFREITLIPAMILLIQNYKFKKNSIIPLVVGVVIFILLQTFISKTNDYNGLYSILKWAYAKNIGNYLLSIFNAFGLVIVLFFVFYKNLLTYLKMYSTTSIALFLIMILAYVGGSDTERFLSWALPFFFILTYKIIKDNNLLKNKYVIFTLLTLVLTYRIFWVIPADVENTNHVFPVLTYLSNDFNFADLLAFHGNKQYVNIQLIEYLVAAIILYFLISKKHKNFLK